MSNCLYFYKFNDNLIYPKTLAEIGKELFIFLFKWTIYWDITWIWYYFRGSFLRPLQNEVKKLRLFDYHFVLKPFLKNSFFLILKTRILSVLFILHCLW